MAHIVTAGAVVAKMDSETGEGYFYRGDTLPSAVSADERKRLVELGLVKVEKDSPKSKRSAPSKPKDGQNGGGDDLDSKTLDELNAYAAEKNIDLGGATLKDDVLLAIKTAESR